MPEYEPVRPKPLSEEDSKTTYTMKSSSKEKIKGGKGDNKPDEDFDSDQLKAGIKIEREHSSDPDEAKEISKDHLTEIPDYYKRLTVMEAKAAKDIKKSLEKIHSLTKSIEASIDEDEMDLKKDDSDDSEETSKGLKLIKSLVKALKAADVTALGRRARMGAAFQTGLVIGRDKYFEVEPVDLTGKLNVGIDAEHVRPAYEPPTVPVRRIATPFEIPMQKCGDHEYKVAKAGPTVAKPFWRR